MRVLASSRLWAVAALVSAVVSLSASSCSEDRRAPPLSPTTTAVGGAGAGGGFDGNPGGGPCVEAGVCGNEIHHLSFDTPNLYFTLDRSGSMAELEPPDYDSRYRIVRAAMLELVGSLGSLINVGAAVFPHGDIDNEPCHAGGEIFPVTPGDPLSGAGGGGGEGPTLAALRVVTNLVPKGGTPIASTVQALTPDLVPLAGRTIVLLLTDGGPNCNAQASCTAAECMVNIAGQCDPNENCCSPGNINGGPTLCIDRAPTIAAIEALATAGVPVYVIGIPGSEIYADVLDEMAVAGGTAQSSGTDQYYRVDDLSALGAVFASIAAEAISCEILLTDPPPDKLFTNVYFDCDVVPYDPVDGWGWKGDDTVWLHGEACQKLESGQVAQVQIATGCPTEKPK